MQLSWQPGFSLARRPCKRLRAQLAKAKADASADGRRQFQFVQECPAEQDEQARQDYLTPSRARRLLPIDDSISQSGSDPGQVRSTAIEQRFLEQSLLEDDEWYCHQGDGPTRPSGTWGADCDARSSPSQLLLNSSATLPPGVAYGNLQHRLLPILERYNAEFCKIPLTVDLNVNPFRYCNESDQPPEFLLHAVMALAGHHVQDPSTESHRQKSLQLIRNSLGSFSPRFDRHVLLDTITILFSLDESQSIFGNWKTHLVGAYNVYEACGGLRNLFLCSRDGAQMGLFVWWDAIISLVSREDCIFPDQYCTAITSDLGLCEWDFFCLCGCPLELAKVVFQLSRLAVEKQKSLSMQYVRFDNSVLSRLKHSLETWQHERPSMSLEDEESMHQDRDRMHCSEAWRHGLLLYLHRVFEWECGWDSPLSVASRAREIVEHVLACREDNMVSKQALLPLFFAACDLRDSSHRRKVVELCSAWDSKTRYHMFQDTVPLLRDIWAAQERHGFENTWWGKVIDEKHKTGKDCPVQTRICFG